MRELTKRLNKALYSINEGYFLNEQNKKISDAELCIMYILDDGQIHSQIEISREWFIPKTTVNSIIGRWVKKGIVSVSAIPGRRREQSIYFTDTGKEYAKDYLSAVYQVEQQAMQKTIDRYSDTFVEAIEYYGKCLEEAFRDVDDKDRG